MFAVWWPATHVGLDAFKVDYLLSLEKVADGISQQLRLISCDGQEFWSFFASRCLAVLDSARLVVALLASIYSRKWPSLSRLASEGRPDVTFRGNVRVLVRNCHRSLSS